MCNVHAGQNLLSFYQTSHNDQSKLWGVSHLYAKNCARPETVK